VINMDLPLETNSRRLFRFAFVSLALFIPFSIAGANFAIGLGALAWLFFALARRDRLYERMGRSGDLNVQHDPLLLAALVLALSALPSALMSEDLPRALKDWKSYWLLFVHFLVAANIARVHSRGGAFWVLFASATLSCLLAFVQRAGGVDWGFIHIGGERRVGGTLYTMTFAGILYQLVVFFAAVALGAAIPARARLILLAGAAVQFVAVLFTMTRGAWVAVVAGLLTACLLIRNRAVAAFASILVVGLVAFSSFYGRDQGRTLSLPALLESSADRNVSTRLVLWDVAWDLFKAHPIMGVGMGDYEAEAKKLVAGREVRTTVDSHNVYLQILSTRGLVGFIPFVAFWVVLFRELFRAKRARPRGTVEWGYAVGAIAVTVAVLVGALTELNIDDEEVFIAFMLLTGLARAIVFTPRAEKR
jgi:O-antigen ligase